jgi:hypothetical protein
MYSKVLGLLRSSRLQNARLFRVGLAVVLVLAIGRAPALAVDHVYWAGDQIWQWDLPSGSNAHVFCNFPGTDVAVDSVNGNMFWADNSTGTGKIMKASLLNCGSPGPLLAPGGFIDQLQIDVNAGMIYWSDTALRKIYRSSIINPSIVVLPLNPGTLRAFALDLRLSSQHLYYMDATKVYRADLDGLNSAQLLNPIGPLFSGIAIDTCTDHLIVIGLSNTVFPLIVRADLSDAGNQTAILQDPTFPFLNVGLAPEKIMLDLSGGTMYWVVPGDTAGVSTLRRANLNGTVAQPTLADPYGPTVIARGTPFAKGIALELANTSCTTVGVNKDLQNNTGQIANDIEILLAGSYANVSHYDGHPANQFASFTESPVTGATGGNTLLTWSNPNNVVQPGQIVHVGFIVPGSSVSILGVSWTRDGNETGCPQQVSTGTHLAGSAGSQVVYTNNVLGCNSSPRYVGGLTVEWHAHQVPLAELNGKTRRNPIRTDVIPDAPIRLAPAATARVNVPEAPPNALFEVVVHKVSSAPTLSGPDVTTDFLEFPVKMNRPAGTGQVCVHKFNDLNGDRVRQRNEPGLPGWVFRVDGGGAPLTLTTDAKGVACASRPAGTYKVIEAQQAGWSPTTPAAQSVTVTAGQIAHVSFGNRKKIRNQGLVRK